MTKTNPDAPAFPSPEVRGPDGCGIHAAELGQSIRQWYAGQFMGHIIATAKAGSEAEIPFLLEKSAQFACAAADAIIAELRKGKP